jgi:hypothetical protein
MFMAHLVSHVPFHVSCVTCHMSRVACHKLKMSPFFLCTKRGASRLMVCYQWGLSRLVFKDPVCSFEVFVDVSIPFKQTKKALDYLGGCVWSLAETKQAGPSGRAGEGEWNVSCFSAQNSYKDSFCQDRNVWSVFCFVFKSLNSTSPW